MISALARTIAVDWPRLARPREWAQSKLPFVGAAALLAVDASPWAALAVLATVVPWAAFGYGINEIADRASDARAGKPNRAAGLSPASRGLFLGLTAGGALGLSLAWAPDAAAPALVLAGLALAAAYSVAPVRLKERGAAGLLAAAAAQWAIPVLAACAVEPGGWLRPAAWALALLGLAVGMRWMAVHQLRDVSADRRAGVRTYAARGADPERAALSAFACELLLLAAVLVLTWPRSLPATAALAFWGAHCVLLRSRRASLRARLRGFDDAPLAGYYFLLLPVALALGREPESPLYLAVAAVLLVLGAPHLHRMVITWARPARVEPLT